MDKEKGSSIARCGFQNERDIVSKFNHWNSDAEAKEWLSIMGFDCKNIRTVLAKTIAHEKTDVNVQIEFINNGSIEYQNIQVKLVSNKNGFNQIDKRWLASYQKLWNMPPNVYMILQLFCGELPPKQRLVRDRRRMFLDEFFSDELKELLHWFTKNKKLIISDIIKGRGEYCADWVLVIQKVNGMSKWILKNIDDVVNYYQGDEIKISKKGSLKIGRVTMQRKGGDAGRPTARMLQFKINPIELFKINL